MSAERGPLKHDTARAGAIDGRLQTLQGAGLSIRKADDRNWIVNERYAFSLLTGYWKDTQADNVHGYGPRSLIQHVGASAPSCIGCTPAPLRLVKSD